LTYHIGGELFDGVPGSVFHIPAGVAENFEPTSTSQVLITYTPGGIDGFFREIGERASSRQLPPPPTSPPDTEQMASIGARYGLEFPT
jgi:hypothetical protein